MAGHHGKTWTQVHGISAGTRARERRVHRQQNRQYHNFGKVNWDFFEHRQLWDMIQSAKPQQMYDKAQQWSQLAERIQATTSTVQGVVQNLLGTWRGTAAVTAGESNTKLTQWAGQAGDTATGVGAGLAKYADAVTHAQATMPEPVDYVAQQRLAEGYAVKVTNPDLHAYLLKNLASDQIATREQAMTAKAKAVRVMEGYESHSQDVHQQLPEFQAAPSMAPLASQPVPPASGAGGSSAGSPLPGGEASPQSPPTVNDPTGPANTTPSFSTPPTVNPSGPPPIGPGYGPLPGGGPNGPTSGIGMPGPGGGFPVGGPAIAGLRGVAVGEGVAGASGRGAAFAGAGNMAAAEEAAATRAAAARGAAGGGGMYPPMGGAGGANGDKDGEHHNKYDDGLDLFDDIPPAYPSVFGA